MGAIIYVPQGFIANLTRDSSYDIDGLYTDSYSSCNIIICIGKDKISLAHADMYGFFDHIVKEIEWVCEPCEVLAIFREPGKHLLDEIKRFLYEKKPSIKLIEKEMDNQHDGVFVSFNQDNDPNFHKQIKKYPPLVRPQNLIHHPQEQKFFTVQKIEQIIGLEERIKTRQARIKQSYIFDGLAWEPLADWHFALDMTRASVKKEMSLFKKTDANIVLFRKLHKLYEKISCTVPLTTNIRTMSLDMAFHLETYLQEYNYAEIFKNNMKDIFIDYVPSSAEDKKLQAEILQLIKNEDDIFNETTKLINEYKTAAPPTLFKSDILGEYETFSRHYQDRKYYHDLANRYKEMLTSAKKLTTQAKQHYQKGQFEAAKNLFVDVVKKMTQCCLKSDADLAMAYYNLGRCYYQLQDFYKARFFLSNCLTLKKHFVNPKLASQEIEKTEKALQECNKKISSTEGKNPIELLSKRNVM